MSGPGFAVRACLFDMDGVVTDTAAAHAAAWKALFDGYLARRGGQLEPFDPDADYRAHVDGRPRYGGVAAFLAARGIVLPPGAPGDPPGDGTVCALGNRKDRYFRDWLAANRVRVYPAARALVAELRAAGLPVGLFTASRNAAAVLESGGVAGMFDARIDGVEAARLGLPGKPDPAVLTALAARLGVPPAEAAVFEDSRAGVRAGRAGGFGLVVGIGAGQEAAALSEAGAHWVVAELDELVFDAAGGRLQRR